MTAGSRVIALTGRRIDPFATDVARFPLSHVERVRQRVLALLVEEQPATIITSAACGADLLALDEAGALGVRRRVVLPWHRERFRTGSVTDRPGDWGALFDRAIDDATRTGDLIVLDMEQAGEQEAYVAANQRILDEASSLAPAASILAVLVWDGISRGDDDLTAAFGVAGAARGFRVAHVPTL